MRKIFYEILCMLMNIKSAFHCWKCGFSYNELNTRTELVDLREALHLLSMGFEPVRGDYTNNGAHDTFDFRRTAALLMALDATYSAHAWLKSSLSANSHTVFEMSFALGTCASGINPRLIKCCAIRIV